MEVKEKKEKKVEMKVLMGLSPLLFIFFLSFFPGAEISPISRAKIFKLLKKNHNNFAYNYFSLKLGWYIENDAIYHLWKFYGKIIIFEFIMFFFNMKWIA